MVKTKTEQLQEKLELELKKVKQLKAALSQEGAKVRAKERKDRTRSFIIWGAALEKAIEEMSLDNAAETKKRIGKYITGKKDREFLGLAPLKVEQPVEEDKKHTYEMDHT